MSQTGVVKLFHKDKGYGFIVTEDGQEIFVHLIGMADQRYLQKGDQVTFDVEESPTKPGQVHAINVVGGTGAFTREGEVLVTGSVQGTCKLLSEPRSLGFEGLPADPH